MAGRSLDKLEKIRKVPRVQDVLVSDDCPRVINNSVNYICNVYVHMYVCMYVCMYACMSVCL